MPMQSTDSIEAARDFAGSLEGAVVFRVWRGAGSAVFLELGELSGGAEGEREMGIGIEWSWRIQKGCRVLLGSWDEPGEIDSVAGLLEGRTVSSVSFFLEVPEVRVRVDGGLPLLSFTTVSGDPQWTLRNAQQRYLYFEGGRYRYENPGP